MSLLLLDTTFLIDAERGNEGLDGLIADLDDVAIAAITVAELLVGVELAAKRHQPARRSYVKAIIEEIPVLDYDKDVAAEHAVLLAGVRAAGRPRGAHDLIVAATARASRRTIISADRTAFDGLAGVNAITYR